MTNQIYDLPTLYQNISDKNAKNKLRNTAIRAIIESSETMKVDIYGAARKFY